MVYVFKRDKRSTLVLQDIKVMYYSGQDSELIVAESLDISRRNSYKMTEEEYEEGIKYSLQLRVNTRVC